MNEEFFKEICSLRKDNGEWVLYDCTNDRCVFPAENRNYPRNIKTRYLNDRENWQKRRDIETVWLLVGIKKDNNKAYEQVGRSKCIINALNEIREDVKEFFRNDGKYGKLKDKNYKKIIFYEVDIKSYLENEIIFNNNYECLSKNKDFELVYYYIAAAYVEGKLGCILGADKNMYHSSTFDGYFYEFYKNQKLK